jgi:hypothetical protein
MAPPLLAARSPRPNAYQSKFSRLARLRHRPAADRGLQIGKAFIASWPKSACGRRRRRVNGESLETRASNKNSVKQSRFTVAVFSAASIAADVFRRRRYRALVNSQATGR